MQGALLEQLDMASVWQIFDALAAGYAEVWATRPGGSSSGGTGGVPASPDSSRGRAFRLGMPALSPQVPHSFLPPYLVSNLVLWPCCNIAPARKIFAVCSGDFFQTDRLYTPRLYSLRGPTCRGLGLMM